MHLCYHIGNSQSDHEWRQGRTILLLRPIHQLTQNGRSLIIRLPADEGPWGCCGGRWWFCHSWTLPRVVNAHWLIRSKSFLLHFFCLLNFNNKENVGHFKSIGRQLFLTQRIMGFSTMNCTSSGRINFDFFFFPHVFIYMWLYFHWYRIKSAFYWPCVCVLFASHELWHYRNENCCFPGQSRTEFAGINEQSIILSLEAWRWGRHSDLLLE